MLRVHACKFRLTFLDYKWRQVHFLADDQKFHSSSYEGNTKESSLFCRLAIDEVAHAVAVDVGGVAVLDVIV